MLMKFPPWFIRYNKFQANPYETSNVATALDRALKMPLEERQLRMFQLKKRERRMDVDSWVKSFLFEMDYIHGVGVPSMSLHTLLTLEPIL